MIIAIWLKKILGPQKSFLQIQMMKLFFQPAIQSLLVRQSINSFLYLLQCTSLLGLCPCISLMNLYYLILNIILNFKGPSPMWENFSFFPCQRVSKSWASFFISRYPIFLVSLKYLPPSSPLYLSFPFPLYHLISSGILSSKWLCSFLNLNTSSWIGVLTDQNMTLQSYRQASVEKETNSGKAVISAQEAEDLKMKEKRKREHEVLII